MKRLLRWAVAAALIVLAGAPFTNAERFGPSIRAGLEAALGRRVEIGSVRLHVLTGAGFSVRNVVIHEDPRVSVEPFAHVGTLVVRLRLLSLLKGKLEFSGLRLEKVHVNLMRSSNGAWNVQSLIHASRESGAPLTEVEVRSGRINFKFDDTKSAYYFTNADMDFSAADAENFDIWFVGEPARTDTLARGFGRITARGRLRDQSPEPRLDLDVRVDKSALQEVSMLLSGADAGVHGTLQSRATVAGPVSRLKIDGRLEMSELHHWTQPPRPGAVSVAYGGELRLPEQSLRLETDAKEPLRARLQLDKYLSTANWEASLAATNLRLATVQEWLRPAGAAFNGMTLEGTVDGEYRVGHSQRPSGNARATALRWKWGDGHVFEAPEGELEWHDGAMRLRAPQSQFEGQAVTLECESIRSCAASTRGVEVAKLRPWLAAFELRETWIDALRKGIARGSVLIVDGQWKGAVELRNGEVALPELDGPIRIASANVSFQDGKITAQNLRMSFAGSQWRGQYRFEPEGERPHRVAIETDLLTSAELERALRPMLRRQRGFLQRVLGLDKDNDVRPSGDVDAEVRAGKVSIGRFAIDGAVLQVARRQDRILIPAWKGTLAGGTVTGSGTIRLANAAPEGEVNGTLTAIPWNGGEVDAEFKAQLRGGQDWAVSGTVTASRVEVGPVAEKIETTFRASIGNGAPNLTISTAELWTAGEKLIGRVQGKSDGPQTITFASDGEEVKLRVTVQPFEVVVE